MWKRNLVHIGLMENVKFDSSISWNYKFMSRSYNLTWFFKVLPSTITWDRWGLFTSELIKWFFVFKYTVGYVIILKISAILRISLKQHYFVKNFLKYCWTKMLIICMHRSIDKAKTSCWSSVSFYSPIFYQRQYVIKLLKL